MIQTKVPEGVKLKSIFHPSDFSEASEIAFAHALKIALVAGAKLTMFHVAATPSLGVCIRFWKSGLACWPLS